MGGCTDVVWMAMVSYSGLASLPLVLFTTRYASLVEVGMTTGSLYGQREIFYTSRPICCSQLRELCFIDIISCSI